jgi:hypothetical protein
LLFFKKIFFISSDGVGVPHNRSCAAYFAILAKNNGGNYIVFAIYLPPFKFACHLCGISMPSYIYFCHIANFAYQFLSMWHIFLPPIKKKHLDNISACHASWKMGIFNVGIYIVLSIYLPPF